MVAVNAELSAYAVAHGGEMPWVTSPTPGVERKRFFHNGSEEKGQVTSIVRYAAGAKFPMHKHPEGEEILVLDGIFSDQTGDYGPGSYLLNPDGTSHAPWSVPGCTIFVKLRQYGDTLQKAVETDSLTWEPGRIDGIQVKWLYRNSDDSIVKRLVKIDAGVEIPAHGHNGGEEVFVLSGDLEDEHGRYGPHCWARYPVGAEHQARTEGGCLLYVQTGGFG